MIRRTAVLGVLACAPFFGAAAQARETTPPTTATSPAPRARSHATGHFLLELNGAVQQSWTYDPVAGTLAQVASPTTHAKLRTVGTGITVRPVSAGSAVPQPAGLHNPIPSIGVVVKKNTSTSRAQKPLTLTSSAPDSTTPSRAAGHYFALPANLPDSTFDVVVTLPRAAIASVAPTSMRGDTEVTITLRKVPGGYDVVRATAPR